METGKISAEELMSIDLNDYLEMQEDPSCETEDFTIDGRKVKENAGTD